MKCSTAICLACCSALLGAAEDDEAALLVHGRSTSHDLRIHIGLAESVDSITFAAVNGGADNDQDFSTAAGISADIELLWNHLHESRLGFVHGPGLAFGLHQGDDNGTTAELMQASVTYRAGLLMRWDNDGFSRLQHLRFELTPIIGAGLAQADVDGSDSSDPGFLLRYGLLFETVADFRSGWSIAGSLGYMGGTAWLDWDNTDGSTVSLAGLTMRLGAGFQF